MFILYLKITKSHNFLHSKISNDSFYFKAETEVDGGTATPISESSSCSPNLQARGSETSGSSTHLQVMRYILGFLFIYLSIQVRGFSLLAAVQACSTT